MQDFKELDDARLTARIEELGRELLTLKEAVRSGKEKNHAKIGLLKRDLARALTARQMRTSTPL